MNSTEYIQSADENLLHAYNRFPIVLEKGDGVYLYDVNGKKYLDFAAGIGVFALGYHNTEYNDAIKDQIDKLLHTSNLFYNPPATFAAKKVNEMTGMDRVFFTNSGTEAIEGAIKLARKYAYQKDGCTDHEIIAMEHSFHGRSMGALSVTGNPKYQEPFKPLIGGIKFAKYNDLESVKSLITDKTCAIILETLQGEGGIYPATEEFIKGIRDICTQKDIVMICDEVQCGMGRTGKMFAYENYGIKPDVVTLAKALGCGVPVGAFAAVEKVASALVPGDHGSTYGGNPFVCAAINEVFALFEKNQVLQNVEETGAYLGEQLEKIVCKYSFIKEQRGMGLMRGLVFDEAHPVGDVINKCLEKGLIIISAAGNVLRMLPPLVITKENVDEMISILTQVLG